MQHGHTIIIETPAHNLPTLVLRVPSPPDWVSHQIYYLLGGAGHGKREEREQVARAIASHRLQDASEPAVELGLRITSGRLSDVDTLSEGTDAAGNVELGILQPRTGRALLIVRGRSPKFLIDSHYYNPDAPAAIRTLLDLDSRQQVPKNVRQVLRDDKDALHDLLAHYYSGRRSATEVLQALARVGWRSWALRDLSAPYGLDPDGTPWVGPDSNLGGWLHGGVYSPTRIPAPRSHKA
mgnify:CR=1 FL=1